MRWFAGLLLALSLTIARADKVILVPLDSRPAAGQFAQMIAHIAGEDLRMPPYRTLGRFTIPGSADEILKWLDSQDLHDVSDLIISSDMICYGGLIASRSTGTSYGLARSRLKQLIQMRRRWPKTKLYVFSSTMRLAPTATRSSMPWRLKLAKYEELRDRVVRLGSTHLRPQMEALLHKVPLEAIEEYEGARARNHLIQKELIHLAAEKEINYLVIGQDDAKPYGPHVTETEDMRREVLKLSIGGHVYFCEGIDQHASILVSRSLLKAADWIPRVRVVYSDPLGRRKYANYESKPIELSLEDQILASGARLALPGEEFDYTLYVNTPKRRTKPFTEWLDHLKADLDQGLPVAVADINLDWGGIGDSELSDALADQGRLMKLVAYAGWNTAGNTLGTAIPTANVYLLAKKLNVPDATREVAQKEFVLHRYVDDYAFHRYTRPVAYSMILSENHDEVYGDDFTDLNDFVERDLQKQVERAFEGQFQNQKFTCGSDSYVITGIKDVHVWLPWPRAYEVRLQFHFDTRKVDEATEQVSQTGGR